MDLLWWRAAWEFVKFVTSRRINRRHQTGISLLKIQEEGLVRISCAVTYTGCLVKCCFFFVRKASQGSWLCVLFIYYGVVCVGGERGCNWSQMNFANSSNSQDGSASRSLGCWDNVQDLGANGSFKSDNSRRPTFFEAYFSFYWETLLIRLMVYCVT